MVKKNIKGALQNFVDSLGLALYDRAIELGGTPVIYYYDADVILKMILGFELDSVANRHQGEETRLVRSLLSCGFFGKLYIRRPHAVELAWRLERQTKFQNRSAQELFAAKARQYLRERGIEDTMARLLEVTQRAPYDSNRAVEEFIAILQENAGPTFSAIESVNGSWLQRMRRYYDSGLLSLDELGPDIRELLSPVPEVKEINHILHQSAPRPPMANFQDSVALGGLVHMIKCLENGEKFPVVRFYTETNALYQAWSKSSRLRELLSYKVEGIPNVSVPRGGEFIVRSYGYFLMRARFEELSPVSSSTSIDALRALLEELQKVLVLREPEIEEALAQIWSGGQSLLSIIKDLEELSLMKAIWTQARLPASFLDAIAGWGEVFAFAQGKSTGDRLFEQIEDVQRELGNKVAQFRSWAQDFASLLATSKLVRSVMFTHVEHPLRDLGLVRWGYTLSDGEKDDLTAMLSRMAEDSEEDLIYECASLATRLEEARSDIRECAFICAVLWALGRFGDIVGVVDSCEGARGSLIPSLIVIRAAAKLKTGFVKTTEERRSLVELVWSLLKSMSSKKRPEILLGVGYVLYHAWKQESIWYGAQGRQIPRDISEWAQRSCQAGEEAVAVFTPFSLAWAFAVNHCAYVGIVTGKDASFVEEYLKHVSTLQGFPEVWNSRFEDTIGCYYLWKLEREVGASAFSRESAREKRLDEMANLAGFHFTRAKENDFGDIDLDEHITRLSIVKSRLTVMRG